MLRALTSNSRESRMYQTPNRSTLVRFLRLLMVRSKPLVRLPLNYPLRLASRQLTSRQLTRPPSSRPNR